MKLQRLTTKVEISKGTHKETLLDKNKHGLVNHMKLPSKYFHLDSRCNEIYRDSTNDEPIIPRLQGNVSSSFHWTKPLSNNIAIKLSK
jgi:hypothetical protein